MGSSPKTPTYNMQRAEDAQRRAVELSQLYSQTEGPFGSVTFQGTGPDRRRVVELGEADQQRQALVQNALAGMNLDPTQATQQYYESAQALQQPALERQTSQVMDRMVKMGIDPTSTGSQEVLGELSKQQALAQNQLATQAMGLGQQYVGQQVGNVGALSGQIRNPLAGYQQQGGFGSTYEQKFASDMERARQKQAGRGALMGTLGTVAGMALGGPLLGTAAGKAVGG